MKASTDAKLVLGNLNPEGALQVTPWCSSPLNGITILKNSKTNLKEHSTNIKAPQSLLSMDLPTSVVLNNSSNGLFKNSDTPIKPQLWFTKKSLLTHLETPSTTPLGEATFSWNLTLVPNYQRKLLLNCLRMSVQRHVLTLRHCVKVSNQKLEVKLLVTRVPNSIELLRACTYKVVTLQRHMVSKFPTHFLTPIFIYRIQ